MIDERRVKSEEAYSTVGTHWATGGQRAPLKSNQRWGPRREREFIARLLRGELVQALSRELGVEICP
ncbi:MAG: hypothetical protein ACP5VS_03275 [Desulfomonilaceae bacterium]